MSSLTSFGLTVLVTALAGLAAVLSSRASERLRIPAPAFFLIAAALASDLWPSLGRLSYATVEHVVTVALAVILFDGGMRMGWRRFRSVAVASVWLGAAGTVVTAAAVAAAAHFLFSFGWHVALLAGAALAPTDPAVVFSVLGRREIAGRSDALLEGESGANDPVGIALLLALLAATGTSLAAAGQVAVNFSIQMVVGVAVGAVGGRALLAFMRRVPLPSEGLYALRVLAGALVVYGLSAVAHGSGFLAVFVAGVVIGDERAPYKSEIAHFHSALASLAEVVAFVMLGLTIHLYDLPRAGIWLTGLALAALLAFVIRPAGVGLLMWPVRLRLPERVFVLWGGLKGAVPILMGAFIVQARIPGAPRVYEIIFVVVAFSVIVQGGTVPELARRLKLPVHVVEPEPWSLGIRFQEEPEDLHRFVVAAGATATATPIGGLPLPEDAWISLVIRGSHPVPPREDTVLQAGDEVVVLASRASHAALRAVFGS
jgi:cell volume regulation protein A